MKTLPNKFFRHRFVSEVLAIAATLWVFMGTIKTLWKTKFLVCNLRLSPAEECANSSANERLLQQTHNYESTLHRTPKERLYLLLRGHCLCLRRYGSIALSNLKTSFCFFTESRSTSKAAFTGANL